MIYHDTKLEKIPEKATIANLDKHFQLILEIFNQLFKFSYFFVVFEDNHMGDFSKSEDWAALIGRDRNGSFSKKNLLVLG